MINHVAIILDGNGRWAKRRLLSRSLGHLAGAKNIEKIVKASLDYGIKELSMFCFSTENWNRPIDEVDYLMSLPGELLKDKIEKLAKSGVKINVCGRLTNFDPSLLKLIKEIEEKTSLNNKLILNICLDYGSKEELMHAIHNLEDHKGSTFNDLRSNFYIKNDVDLLIRTSGEKRLSNFLLLQLAYAELEFTKTNWPDFSKKEYFKILDEFKKRDRRFGKV